jgi:type IV secretory pathway TraG/TraD family ATPase VirD4
VLGAGVADEKFLAEFSDLVGDHEEWIVQSVSTGRGERQVTRSLRKERTLAVSHLASMPKERAIVFASGSRPVVIETVPWQDGPHATEIRAALAKATALPPPIRAGRCTPPSNPPPRHPSPIKERGISHDDAEPAHPRTHRPPGRAAQ